MLLRILCAKLVLLFLGIAAQDSLALVIDDFTDGEFQFGPGLLLDNAVQEGLNESAVVGGRRQIRRYGTTQVTLDIDTGEGGSFSYAKSGTWSSIALYYGSFDATGPSMGLDLTQDGSDTLAVDVVRSNATSRFNFAQFRVGLGLVSGAFGADGTIGGLYFETFVLPNSDEPSTLSVSFQELAARVNLTDVDRLFFEVAPLALFDSAELKISRIYTYSSVPEPSTMALLIACCLPRVVCSREKNQSA